MEFILNNLTVLLALLFIAHVSLMLFAKNKPNVGLKFPKKKIQNTDSSSVDLNSPTYEQFKKTGQLFS